MRPPARSPAGRFWTPCARKFCVIARTFLSPSGKLPPTSSIGGWRLPEATTLGIGIYLTHRRASSFEDPDRFWPERFLTARPSRFEYLPFGGGRRGCVAGPFYVFVQKMILAAAFERFRLRLCDRRNNPVTLMAIVSSPSRPLWVIAEPA